MDVLSTCRLAIDKATKAAAALVMHEDLPGCHVDTIEGFTIDWLEDAIGVHLDAIKSDKTLTAAERAKKFEMWRNIKKISKTWVNTSGDTQRLAGAPLAA